MTIRLLEDLKRYVQDQIQSGRFLSEDDVIADALKRHQQAQPNLPHPPLPRDPVIASMSEDAKLLDEIVAQAMTDRREQPWRWPDGE